ncbi:MAG: CPBP family intramembrane metalloprotease [Clostridia bacterium]|nr:CPBP family intramembrane metalloprotease [Clostridia bacterium]
MLANNIRRNPFAVAPALALFLLIPFGVIGRLPIRSLGTVGAPLLMLVLTIVIFCLPTIFFFYLKGNTLFHFGFRKMTGEGLSVAVTAGVLLCILSILVSGGLFGDAYDYKTYTLYGTALDGISDSVGGGILLFFAAVLFPVLLEGIFFRGIMMYEYRHGGFLIAATCSSLLYAMTEMDFFRFPARFLIGFLLCLVVFLTGNILYSMLSHAIYAVFSLFAEKYFIFIAKEPEARALFFFVFSALFLFMLFLLIRAAEKMLRVRGEAEDAVPVRMPKGKRPLVLYDIFSAPMLWADIFCFALFAVLNIFL